MVNVDGDGILNFKDSEDGLAGCFLCFILFSSLVNFCFEFSTKVDQQCNITICDKHRSWGVLLVLP